MMILLSLPAFFSKAASDKFHYFYQVFFDGIICILIFLIPIFLFYRNVKVYFWLLFPLALLSPLIIFSILSFKVAPGWHFFSLILQTNINEAKELGANYLAFFLPLEALYIGLYVLFLKKLDVKTISFRIAAAVSVVSLFSVGAYLYLNNQLHLRGDNSVKKYYPMSLVGGVVEVLKYEVPVDNQKFSFQAYQSVATSKRQIQVFIIGESSRYDRWHINGYNRPTSPLLEQQTGLIAFSNVMAGAHATWMSLPQMITRATPKNIDAQFHEKSILSAFKEANFQTAWLSNQSDKELYFSGTTPIHAKTADYSVFSSNSSGLEILDVYDARLLPILDSVLSNSTKNAFVVLHTMGNHYDYPRRYPSSFNVFKPSGKDQAVGTPTIASKDIINNSYDNSILYADYIINSAIELVKKKRAISTVTFLADHGENLYDLPGGEFNAHTKPSIYSLHVPLFIWTSQEFDQAFPQKRQNLIKNKDKRIGAGNIFFTNLALANVTFSAFEPSQSIVDDSFQENEQEYYDLETKKSTSSRALRQH
ncbi:hypothetical protein BEN48_15310 [Hymenobacter glacialis]|uniref:Sulfatase N-terminal domain-containing protein n=2 Tax=Hymenobacter glacialis TaxID=1908236 RepID=A0A1G1T2B4_9BACT|nr:hypothetical protein BEN48_15310 [Hymenobacter glacialis]